MENSIQYIVENILGFRESVRQKKSRSLTGGLPSPQGQVLRYCRETCHTSATWTMLLRGHHEDKNKDIL